MRSRVRPWSAAGPVAGAPRHHAWLGACLAERLFEKLHVNDEKLLPRFSPRNDLRRRGADQAALLPWGAPG